METHLSKIKDGETHAHYLGQHTQNELIQIVSDKILEAIVTQVRDSKYLYIILDCTPDISHQEQTVKSWSDTRWESRLQSVHAIRYQASEVREALLEVRQMINDPMAKVEAQALAEEVGSYRFLICCVVWCEILTR